MVNKTVLITGVAGLLGSRLADWIIENHPEVTVVGIDDLSGGFKENVHPNVSFLRMDLSSEAHALDAVFTVYNPDLVYHFAAYAAEALSPFIRQFNYQNNLVATANIVNCCIKHNVKRLVFTSTMAVYGEGTPPFEETHPRMPVDPYGIAKAACEMDIQVAGWQHDLDWCIIRPHNVYGAKQNIWDSYRNVLGIWMYKSLHDQPLTIYGDGMQERAFSYIDDSLSCLWTAGVDEKCSKQIINLGGIYHTTILDAATTLLQVVGHGEVEFLPPRHEVRQAFPTYQKSVDLLGFEHKTDLHEGLTKMWEWVKEQPERPRFVWEQYELDKGVYPYWSKDSLTNNSKSVKLL